jgi:hypothetical protein
MIPRLDRSTSRRMPMLVAALLGVLLGACDAKEAQPPSDGDKHLFVHPLSGVGIELPAMWAGRYAVTDSITTPTAGLEREISMRLIRGDSSRVAEPLLVLRVFSNAGWSAASADSAVAMWGKMIAQDAARTLVLQPARGNPLSAEMPDAATFDSLMLTLLGRPMQASLRAPTP